MSATAGDIAWVREARDGAARAGRLTVRGRTMQTPAFLPVGTYGSVKGMTPAALREAGSSMILANACHLHDRPGADVVAQLGGLHAVMGWDGPILTDSGGFQVFSLLDVARLDDDGVSFRSPIDGRALRLGPREVVDVQLLLDSDIAMVFDHCPPLPSPPELLETAVRRTTDWAARALEHHRPRNTRAQALFAIVQGGLDDALRARSARELTALPFDGFAVGGLSVGEGSVELQAAMHRYAPLLPEERVRYVMGVGRPEDVLEAVSAGFDVFDSVMPSRNGRHGTLFTSRGVANLRNARWRTERGPVDPDCDCIACRDFSAGTLRHLVKAGEILGGMLGTAHNLRFLHRLVADARRAILEGRLAAFVDARRAAWRPAAAG